MEANEVAGVELPVESAPAVSREPALRIRMLGRLAVSRDGAAVALPASRKVRALLGYLAISAAPVSRSRLCQLLWDVPDDPRGELRWCLSKLRRVLDGPDRRRVRSEGDNISLDLADCFVDALEIARAAQAGMESLDAGQLQALSALFAGEFLDGLEIARSPDFNTWLTAERRRFHGRHLAVLEHLVERAGRDDVLDYLDRWLQLAPFDRRVHGILLRELARRGRNADGEKHVAAAAQLFEAEGLDSRPLRQAWRNALAETGRGRVTGGTGVATLPEPSPADTRRASIAVMPFVDRDGGDIGRRGGHADGLVHDVITRLAKLRSLFVIAQGTVFALDERSVSGAEAGRMLDVDYVVTGSVRRTESRLRVTVELAEVRSARVVWAERFDHAPDDAFFVLDAIGNRIVASIASEVETAERNRAMLKPPNSLDAWDAHHRGLWHMYRFNRAENEKARGYFELAVRLDPTFARASAGLSFTHFQNAFQGWGSRAEETARAFEAAGQALMADDRDPAAHWAMGRALWLKGQQEKSLVELERSVELSPNFALGHYALGFVRAQTGDAEAAIVAADYSRELSPFDPLLFAMLATRAIALVRMQRFAEAAEWAGKAAARPNSHPHSLAVSALSLALAGAADEGRAVSAAIRSKVPRYRVDDFLAGFRFTPEDAALFRRAAGRVGLD